MVVLSNSWETDPLDYLVRVKFPYERSYRATTSLGSFGSGESHNSVYLKNAAEYRKELRALPRSELMARAEEVAKSEALKAAEKRAAEEAQRWFSQQSADADISHWSRMSAWTLDEAVALSLGKDPRKVNWDKLKSLVGISPFAEKYQAQREIFNRAKLAGQLWDSTIPGVLIAWAGRMRVEFPSVLVDAIKDLGIQISDWKSAFDRQKDIAEKAQAEAIEEKKASIKMMQDHSAYIGKLSSDYKKIIESHKTEIARLERALADKVASENASHFKLATPTKKGLGTKERNSLLTLVIGMAAAWYGYDAAKTRNATAKDISDELQRVGLSLSDDTIRAYLNEARDLLPPPETEQKR